MRTAINAGKVVAGLFWLVVMAALFGAFAKPFDQVLGLLGLLLIALHGVQLWLFANVFNGRRAPWLDRAQVMVFGVFHLMLLQPGLQLAAESDAEQAQTGAAHA
ncbi:DUF1145 domain-containing protein [Pseudomonas borbori]